MSNTGDFCRQQLVKHQNKVSEREKTTLKRLKVLFKIVFLVILDKLTYCVAFIQYA